MFLAAGAVHPGMPAQFAFPAAIGDTVAALLAFASIFAVLKNLKSGRILLWVFNIEGSIDLIVAITLATVYEAPAYMGAAVLDSGFLGPGTARDALHCFRHVTVREAKSFLITERSFFGIYPA